MRRVLTLGFGQITLDAARKIVGDKYADKIENLALAIYKAAHAYAVSGLPRFFLGPPEPGLGNPIIRLDAMVVLNDTVLSKLTCKV